MKNFFLMGYLVIMALTVLIGLATFMSLDLPLNDNVDTVIAWCVAFISFERICSLVGFIK